MVLAAAIVWMAVASAVASADWPTYRHDAARSGVTDEAVAPPLEPAWVHRPPNPPQPAWPPPASNDYFHRKHNLTPRVTYDRAYHVAVAGTNVFFGTSADDRVVCLDLNTGAVRWTVLTDGPVRLAPTVADGRVYAGSDDGQLYCLSAADGRLIWKQRIAEDDACCLGNGRLVSRWPIRTGVVVHNGVAYAAAGLFPTTEGVFLAAYDAATGRPRWRQKIACSPQGYLAVAGDRLLVPTGRTAPALFALKDGKPLGSVRSQGGDVVQATGGVLAAGPGDTGGVLALSDAANGASLIDVRALGLAVRDDRAYLMSDTALTALDWAAYLPAARRRAQAIRQRKPLEKRKDDASKAEAARLKKVIDDLTATLEGARRWETAGRFPFALALAGPTLFAGGDGEVVACRADDGQRTWSGKVDGRAYGLATAGGRLLASTDTGAIHCFRPPADAPTKTEATPARPADVPDDQCIRKAEALLDLTGIRRGICLVLNVGTGDLARALAEASDLHVIGLETNVNQVAEARRRLLRAGLYGRRVVVHHRDGRLPFPPYLANLIVSAGPLAGKDLPEDAKGLRRLLRPCGGTLCLGPVPAENRAALTQWLQRKPWTGDSTDLVDRGGLWGLVRRGPLPGAGEWTHGLADPGNTACSGDRRVGGPMRIQWFGRPGPDQMADRHHRNVPPLYKAGRLFVPGDDRVIVVDAYNGTPIWQKTLPRALRLGAFLDTSNMAVDDDALYVAVRDACHVLDAADGTTRRRLLLPQPDQDRPHQWGYLARAAGVLVGAGRRPEASYWQQSREADQRLWGDAMRLVTSDYLFAVDPRTGDHRWTYRTGGVLINTSIAIGDGRVYVIESASPKALATETGRMPMTAFGEGPNHLTAIAVETGRVAWRRPVDLARLQHIVYLSYADGRLIMSGNQYVEKRLWYHVLALDAATGRDLWHESHNSGYKPGGGHGEQNRHPTLVGDTVYAYPRAYALASGRPVEGWTFARHGHGCGNISASMSNLFWRGANPWRWDLGPGGQPHRLNTVTRPGCFINMIPAGGLLLIPEASSGCTCAYPIQTSVAYVPAEDVAGEED